MWVQIRRHNSTNMTHWARMDVRLSGSLFLPNWFTTTTLAVKLVGRGGMINKETKKRSGARPTVKELVAPTFTNQNGWCLWLS